MSKISNTSVLSLLPEVLRSDPDAIAAAESLSSRSLFQEDMNGLLFLFDSETLKNRDEVLLDHLYEQEHVDLVSAGLSAKEKAELIYLSPTIHRRKGTAWAVKQVVTTVFSNAKISEWFEYGGAPYMFQVEVETSSIKEGDIGRLRKVIESTKNLRSALEAIIIFVATPVLTVTPRAYDFPIYYPITNVFQTASLAGFIERLSLMNNLRSYSFEVRYPITNMFVANGNQLNIEDDMNMGIRTIFYYAKYNRPNDQNAVMGEVTL